MKKFAVAAAFAIVGSAALAGGMDAPVMEVAPVIEETTSSSAGGMLLPILLLALVAAAVSAD